MALTDTTGLSAADIAAVTGNNNGFGAFGGDGGAWLILVLLLFAAFNGNGGWGNGGGVPYAGMQQGFDQQAVMSGLGTVQGSLAALGTQNCNDRFDIINTLTSGHNTILQQIADVKYALAQEACADRAAVQAMGQTILDKICQQEIDALKTQVANLQTQINMANLAASQTGQTAQLIADNTAQTMYLKQTLNPTPIPAYIVTAPGTTPTTGT